MASLLAIGFFYAVSPDSFFSVFFPIHFSLVQILKSKCLGFHSNVQARV